jgi:hypothetical protein
LSRNKPKKFKSRRGPKHAAKAEVKVQGAVIEPEELARRQKYFDYLVAAGLFVFGVYQKYFDYLVAAGLFVFGVYLSILYFGHTEVPISDFPDLFKVGQDILSFRLPSRFKQAPVLGMLQFTLSHFVSGEFPNLTAGWLLNAILYPFNLLLLWFVGKKIVGTSAIWIAIIAIINPWSIYLLTEPINETTLLFFMLMTYFFMFRRSRWSYLFASITTMVRYEGLALILACFVMDMIYAKSKRQRVMAFAYSAIAAVPFMLWMLGTILTWKEGTHYLSVFFSKKYSAEGFSQSTKDRTGLLLHMKLLWQVGFRPLFMTGSKESLDMVWKLTEVFAVVGIFFGMLWGLIKKNWNILALLIFFVPYFILHARYPYPLQRFHSTIFPIALIICWFGWQNIWKLIDGKGRVPKVVSMVLQGLVLITGLIWFFTLIPYVSKMTQASPTSASVPYVAVGLGILIFAGRVYVYRSKQLLRELSILAVLCLIVFSNQFRLAGLVSTGQKEVEFKQLAQWYLGNTSPGKKMAIYSAGLVRIFAPERTEDIVRPPKADNPQAFVRACLEEDLTYLVWATREGLYGPHTGYKQLKLDQNMAMLARPMKKIGPFEFVTQIGSERKYVKVFRLLRPEEILGSRVPKE